MMIMVSIFWFMKINHYITETSWVLQKLFHFFLQTMVRRQGEEKWVLSLCRKRTPKGNDNEREQRKFLPQSLCDCFVFAAAEAPKLLHISGFLCLLWMHKGRRQRQDQVLSEGRKRGLIGPISALKKRALLAVVPTTTTSMPCQEQFGPRS